MVGDAEVRLIETEAKRQNIKWESLTNDEKLFITNRFKALIFRQKWHTEGYYKVLNETDKMVQKALITVH